MKNKTQIRSLIAEDIKTIVFAFNKIGWNKSKSLFEGLWSSSKTLRETRPYL